MWVHVGSLLWNPRKCGNFLKNGLPTIIPLCTVLRDKLKMAVLPTLPSAELSTLLSSRHILVVGGTAGIGKAIAVAAIKRGAEVTVVGRREPDSSLWKAKFVQKDLSLLRNAEALADEVDIETVDTIVLTVGICPPQTREESAEGLETHIAVSYLSRYAFLRKVATKEFGSRRKTQHIKPRIFILGQPGENIYPNIKDFNSEQSYEPLTVHANTVLGNEFLVMRFTDVFEGTVNVYGVHPGIVNTTYRDNHFKGKPMNALLKTLLKWSTPSADQVVEKTIIHILFSPDLEGKSGERIDSKRSYIPPAKILTLPENVEKLLATTEKFTNIAISATLK